MRQLRPACWQCIFWVADHTTSSATTGHCHRFPPGVFANPATGTVVQKFPTTERHGWCGEWNSDEGKWTDALARLVAKG
jgi:hypothetical protein